MPERVLNEAGAVSVELVLDLLQDFRSLRDRLCDDFVAIGELH